MDVTLSVPGRFHGFDLARELASHGCLKRLITPYPKFKAREYGIPDGAVDSIPSMEILRRGWRKLPSCVGKAWNPQFFLSELYDRKAAQLVPESDLVVAWAGFGLRTIRRAKELGAKTVIERGSSHIRYQTEILEEEYGKFGLRAYTEHPKVMEKELTEYEEADYISVPSSYVKRTFVERGIPEGKLIQIPYGVDLSSFRRVKKEDDIFRVVFAGGMSIRKGVHYLLQAFAELKLPNSELLLVGEMTDEMKPFFKKYEGRYRHIGRVPQRELHQWYSQGSVFVIMSVEEGLALVQLQALACGLPVICTENTGGADVVRDGIDGFVIPIRAVDKLKEKLLYLYEHPAACEEMSKSAEERVSSGFTWEDYGDKIMQAYRRICKNV